ncbi:GDSL-type esterase/lipase family protein [Lentzea sp. NPDC058450]|uniref:GDSL-type esterase/lipase family protein n=1 Tax=Lentzea sp. NPDC058450 TaxID=3346505 RepID=UPI00364B06A3
MTITLKAGSTAMFTGDSITSFYRHDGDDPAGYPLQAAGRWCFDHPDRPLTWLNTAHAGDSTADLEARWHTDVLAARPDVLTVLVGVNDVGNGRTPDEFAATYSRLLTPLAGTPLILVEPFLLPVTTVVQTRRGLIGEPERARWREALDPMIDVVRDLARTHGAALLAADRMFADLSAQAGPEHWTDDGVHPNAAGHSALAEAWLALVE